MRKVVLAVVGWMPVGFRLVRDRIEGAPRGGDGALAELLVVLWRSAEVVLKRCGIVGRVEEVEDRHADA